MEHNSPYIDLVFRTPKTDNKIPGIRTENKVKFLVDIMIAYGLYIPGILPVKEIFNSRSLSDPSIPKAFCPFHRPIYSFSERTASGWFNLLNHSLRA